MIIATGTLNIDENTKLAQKASKDAKKAADSASDEAGKIKTSLDGKITVSLKEPFNDGNDHEEGDIWYVQDEDHITSEMYTYGYFKKSTMCYNNCMSLISKFRNI